MGTKSGAQKLTLTNLGGDDLTLAGIALSGANTADFALADGGTPGKLSTPLAPNASCELVVAFTATGGGPRTGEMVLTSDGGTVDVAMSVTGILPPTDVGVSIGATPSPARVGKSLTYTLTMRNAGPDEAYDVRLTDAIPNSTTFTGISAPSDAACSTPAVGGTGAVSCAVKGTLGSGAVRIITLVVDVLSGGRDTVSNTATPSTASPDPQSANDTATVTTTVTTTVYGRK